MLAVYNYMAIALGISGAVAFLTASSPALLNAIFGTPLAFVVMLAPVIFVFVFARKINSLSNEAAKNYLWIFAALMGLSLATVFVQYTGASVARVFLVSASTFGLMSLYGYATKKDLSGLGSFLIMGLIGLLIASIVNIFMQSSAMQFALSVVGVFIFIGLTAYDTQKIKQSYYYSSSDSATKMAVFGALNLYMDFINLFLMMLQLFGDRRN